MAALTLPLIFCAFSENSARRLRTTSSTPPSSPALTMLTKRRLKILGCWASASEKVLPPSMESDNSPRISFRVRLRSCFSRTRSPRRSGRPASTSVANWRVKVVRTLGFTRPLRKGILICDVHRAALLALFARGGLGFFGGALFLDLVGLDDFGRERLHVFDAADGFVLAGGLNDSFGFLAAIVKGYVSVFWHNSRGCPGGGAQRAAGTIDCSHTSMRRRSVSYNWLISC